MCNTGNCNTLILGERDVGACPTCHSRRQSNRPTPIPIAIETPWKTFNIGEILSRTGAYKEADFISGIFYGSTKGGKTCATASFLKEVIRFQPERWSKESAFVFSSKPEETGWSNCMSASNVSKPVENDKGKLVLDQDKLRQIPKLKFPNRKFVCFDDVQSNISQGNDELSNYFTAGRHDDIDVLVLCQSMLKSRADIHSNVKFVFCFAGVQFSKVAEKYCFNHPKEAEKLLMSIVNKKLYRCAVIDMWKRDYDSSSCADYIFGWIPENVSISSVSFPVTNDVVMEAPLETNEVVGVPKKKGGKKKGGKKKSINNTSPKRNTDSAMHNNSESANTPSRGNEGLDEEVSEDDKKIVKTVHSMIENKVGVFTEQIKGLDEVVNKLSSKIVLQFLNPSIAGRSKKTFLLFGPPGNGKTMLVKALSNIVDDVTLFKIQPDHIKDRYLGTGEKVVSYLFKVARQQKFSILFFDECEDYFESRDSPGENHMRGVLNSILQQLEEYIYIYNCGIL